MWHRRITVALSALAVFFLAISGPGTRAGLWPLWVGVGLFAGAMLCGLAAAGGAIVGLALPQLRRRGTPLLVSALAVGVASAAIPLDYIHRLMVLPYINDITTDGEHPPQFSPPKEYPDYFAELQRIGYPDLHTLELALPPPQAFARAVAVGGDLGWELVTLDEGAGRIEAVATTPWFGFKDDVAIRITAAGAGSRIDVRSRSRLGRSDAGANTQRIREFLARMAAR